MKPRVADTSGALASPGRNVQLLGDPGLPVEHLLMQHAHVVLLDLVVVLAAEQLLPLRSAGSAPTSGALCVNPDKGSRKPSPLNPALCSEIEHHSARCQGHRRQARRAIRAFGTWI